MTTVMTLPRGRPLTRADLDDRPDDGHRYELLDGALIVTPAPIPRHQRVVGRLYITLTAAAPAGTEVFVAPLDVVLADDTVLQPDVLVARASELTERALMGAPLLAVEVLSPSTRRIDLLLKRDRYEAAGCAAYWVVDPDEPALSAWQLVDGVFQESGYVTGNEPFTTKTPFPVAVTPSALTEPP